MRLTAVCVTLVLAVSILRAQEPAGLSAPLPDPEPFFEAVRQNIARAQREQNRFAYKERRTDLHTNPFGRLGTGGTRVFDVRPAPDGMMAFRQLIARNDVPVEGSAPERFRLPLRREGGSRSLQDIVQTLSFTLARREMFEGQPAIVVDFAPRPGARPVTRQGKVAKSFKGSMWVDERALEVAHVEATAVDDLSFGLGLVARVSKGAQVSAERRPVDGGVWMPTAVRFRGTGRAMVFRKLGVDFAVDWFDYRIVVPAQ